MVIGNLMGNEASGEKGLAFGEGRPTALGFGEARATRSSPAFTEGEGQNVG